MPEKQRIPTDEDFSRASAYMKSLQRIYEAVRADILKSFAGRAPLHELYLFGSPDTYYHAAVFYSSDADIEACRVKGIEQLLKDAISSSLALQSHDTGAASRVIFTFDSHENVMKQCNGNYFQYLR